MTDEELHAQRDTLASTLPALERGAARDPGLGSQSLVDTVRRQIQEIDDLLDDRLYGGRAERLAAQAPPPEPEAAPPAVHRVASSDGMVLAHPDLTPRAQLDARAAELEEALAGAKGKRGAADRRAALRDELADVEARRFIDDIINSGDSTDDQLDQIGRELERATDTVMERADRRGLRVQGNRAPAFGTAEYEEFAIRARESRAARAGARSAARNYPDFDDSQMETYRAALSRFMDDVSIEPAPEGLPTGPAARGAPELGAPSPHPDDAIIAAYLRDKGIAVNDDNTVTLYHATPAKEAIEAEGLVRATTGKNVGSQIEAAAWFTPFAEDLRRWNAHGSYGVVEVRVPARYLRHLPQTNEFYFEGGLAREADGLWRPLTPPRENWMTKIARRDFSDRPPPPPAPDAAAAGRETLADSERAQRDAFDAELRAINPRYKVYFDHGRGQYTVEGPDLGHIRGTRENILKRIDEMKAESAARRQARAEEAARPRRPLNRPDEKVMRALGRRLRASKHPKTVSKIKDEIYAAYGVKKHPSALGHVYDDGSLVRPDELREMVEDVMGLPPPVKEALKKARAGQRRGHPNAQAAAGETDPDVIADAGPPPLQPTALERRGAGPPGPPGPRGPRGPRSPHDDARQPQGPRSSAGILAAVLEAPPGEARAETLWRLHDGQIELEMTEFLDAVNTLRAEAKERGLTLTRRPTLEMQTVMQVLHFDAPITDLPPDWQAWVRGVRKLLDTEEARMLAVDPEFERRLLPDYWPQFWKKVDQNFLHKERKGPSRGKLKLGQKVQFQRQRKLRGSLEAVLSARPDLDLITWDPLELLSRRIAQGVQARANMVQLERMKMLGMALPRSQAPADWVVPRNAPAFQAKPVHRAARAVGKEHLDPLTDYLVDVYSGRVRHRKTTLRELALADPGGIFYTEPWAVPPDVAVMLNNQFDPSAFAHNTPLKIVRGTVAALKTLKVFGGLFQHIDYSTRLSSLAAGEAVGRDTALAARQLKGVGRAWYRGFAPGADRALTRWDARDPVRRAILAQGLNTSGGRDILEQQFREVLEDRSFLFGKAQASDNRAVARVAGAADYLTSGAFIKAHREYLLTAAEMLTKKYMRDGDSLTRAAAKAVRRVNEEFSSPAPWQSWTKDPTTRDVMRTLFFAPAEMEGWFRIFLRPFKGPDRARAVRFWAGLLGTAAVYANAINFLSTGKPLPPEAYAPFNEDGDWITYNTRFLRPELPWRGGLGRKLYLDLLGQADTPFRWVGAPDFALKSRLGQIPSAGWQLASGRRFLGSPIEDTPRGYAEFAAEQVSPIPATGAYEELARIGTGGAASQAAGFNVSAERIRDLRRREQQRLAREMFNKDFAALNDAERRQVNRSERLTEINDESRRIRQDIGGEARETVRREQKSEELLRELVEKGTLGGKRVTFTTQDQDKDLLATGEITGKQWVARYRERQDDYFTAKDAITAALDLGFEGPEPTNDVDRAIDAYFSITPDRYLDATGAPKWDEYFRARETAYNRATRLGGPLVAEYLRPLAEDPIVRQFKAAADLEGRLRRTVPKYKGVNVEQAREIDSFVFGDVPQETRRLELSERRDYTEREVARFLAAQRGQPALYDWYDTLKSQKKRTAALNPAYDAFLLDNQEQLERWFPDYYTLALYRRAGLVDEEEEEEAGAPEPVGELVPLGVR
jgi:hypothetical protein